jgi:uncharacterized protein YkwD
MKNKIPKIQQINIFLLITMINMFLIMTSSATPVHAMDGGTIISEVNGRRQSAGLAALRVNGGLTAAAQSKANDMVAGNYWAHNNPVNGKTPWYFIRNAGYQFAFAGENLARNFRTESALVNMWMNSASHRANILSTRYSETGIALVNSSKGILVVEMYGSR